MELKTVKLEIPEGYNIILGQTHFIKTVEDLYEIMASTVPNAKFGIAFCEASGACLLRLEGNDDDLKKTAETMGMEISAGHTFVVVMKDAFPINVLNAIKMCQEVCSIYCATANPVEVIIVETEQGKGIMGVIDGSPPKGVEKEDDAAWRKDLLRKFKYKL
ncbi:MAG: adenosine-specific kinase [Syntrophobacterales bacterium]|nr:MAG: adenosine-specific kinase [Syntrophobacterales bacterium]